MDIKFFDFFQLICLFFFLFIFVGRTLYLRVRRNIQVFSLGIDKRGWQQIVEVSFLFGFILWVVEIYLYSQPGNIYIFPAPFNLLLLDSIPIKFIGAALILIGQIIFILALLAFGNSWRIGIDKRSSGQLITSGIFAMTRNPIYIFLDLYFIGTFLINGTVIFLLFAALIVAGSHYQILQEEKFLSLNYGKAYQDYQTRTTRYLGWRHG